ncbi:RDD family protein [Nocardioides daejeonensis]|uniref:RDD family protein n=1 Tax=Nocardioides daejeonensis TaxID=1046556 RepID=UPI000D74AA58|nr:RDD family protein [Nocardioides daejeonensis]
MSEPFPQQPQQPPTGPVPGSLLERFVARLLDGLIVGIPTAIVLGIIFGILGIAGETIGTILISAIIGVAQLGYMVYFESTTGQTIGKKVMNLRVVNAQSAVPTQEEAIKRNIWLALSLFAGIPVLGVLTGLGSLAAVIAIAVTINSNPFGRGWHDNFADTAVVKSA